MEQMANPIEAKKKPKKKKKQRVNHLGSGDPKHHLVHVHVNVVNTAQGDTKGKKANEADDALRNLRGY